jgi:hypothetical protein
MSFIPDFGIIRHEQNLANWDFTIILLSGEMIAW